MDRKNKTGWPKTINLLPAVVLTLSVGLNSLAVPTTMAQSQATVKVLIAFNIYPGPAEEALVRGVGGQIKYTYNLVPAIAATIPLTALDGLRRNPNVVAVDLDLEVYTSLMPNWTTPGEFRIEDGHSHAPTPPAPSPRSITTRA